MFTTFAQVMEIYKTLPIGYYLGRNIKCELSETGNASYFDPIHDNIVISYMMIAQAVENIEEKDITDISIEEVIRGLLYHEISHVILTPRMEMPKHRNIVEDERIERLTKNVYMNTNFFKNLLLINNYKGEAPTDVDSAFYHLVRFHKGEPQWLKALDTLLATYSTINADSYCYYYARAIDDFYRDFCDWYNQHNTENQTNQNSQSSSDAEASDENANTNDGNSNMDADEENEVESNTQMTNDSDDAENNDEDNSNENNNEDALALNAEKFKEISETVINKYHDTSMITRLMNIVSRAIKRDNSMGAAIHSYSGKLNPRAIADRDDYKWWTTQNRMGHLKQNSKLHFNLFIDNSGSFSDNDPQMNTFIRALDLLTKTIGDFTFDVITINSDKVDEWENHNKEFRSRSGSALHHSIKDVIKRHNNKKARIFNLVMFDGDAHCHDNTKAYSRNDPFKHFDMFNTFIISDDDNKRYIDHLNMKKVRVKYVTNYCEEFISMVMNLLEKSI